MLWDVSNQIGKKISVRNKGLYVYYDVERIRYIMCDGHYCLIYLLGESEGIRYMHSLKSFEKELENLGFIRVNHNTLVNVRYTPNVHITTTKRSLRVEGGENGKIESIIVSKRKVVLFK